MTDPYCKLERWLLAMSRQVSLCCSWRQEVMLQRDTEVWLRFAPLLHLQKGSMFFLLVFQKSDTGQLAKCTVNRHSSGTQSQTLSLSSMLKPFFLNICLAEGSLPVKSIYKFLAKYRVVSLAVALSNQSCCVMEGRVHICPWQPSARNPGCQHAHF